MKAGTRVVIIGVHRQDAFYPTKDQWIGKTATLTCAATRYADKRTYKTQLVADNGIVAFPVSFYRVHLKVLREE